VNLDGDCVKFSETTYEPGSALQAGKAFAIVTTVFGVLTVAVTIALTFVRFPAAALLAMAVSSFVMATFSSIVVGVGFGEEVCSEPDLTCSPASMMYVVLVGLLFWIAAGVTLLQVKKFERPGLDADEGAGEADEVASQHLPLVCINRGGSWLSQSFCRWRGWSWSPSAGSAAKCSLSRWAGI
jgi:hypothetical protein